MTDAQRLDALRALHEKWGDTDTADLSVQSMWEEMGLALGTLCSTGPGTLAVVT